MAGDSLDSIRYRQRVAKKARILALFSESVGQEFSSAKLHEIFGTAFRSRVSEINRDPTALITIINRTYVHLEGQECSVYWSAPKQFGIEKLDELEQQGASEYGKEAEEQVPCL